MPGIRSVGARIFTQTTGLTTSCSNTVKANPLIKAAIAAGCAVSVAHIWHHRANRKFERSTEESQRHTEVLPTLRPPGAAIAENSEG